MFSYKYIGCLKICEYHLSLALGCALNHIGPASLRAQCDLTN